jgi:hypothetical protein
MVFFAARAYIPLVMEARMSKKAKRSLERSAADATRNEAWLTREAALLEEGRDDIRAGRCISGAALYGWLEGLDGDQELSVPDRPSDQPHP